MGSKNICTIIAHTNDIVLLLTNKQAVRKMIKNGNVDKTRRRKKKIITYSNEKYDLINK